MIGKTTYDFIWKGSSNHGIQLVGWNKVTLPMRDGGLRVLMARDTNVTLLGKLVWDMQSHQDRLWVHLLTQKYVPHGSFLDGNIYNLWICYDILDTQVVIKDIKTSHIYSSSSSRYVP